MATLTIEGVTFCRPIPSQLDGEVSIDLDFRRTEEAQIDDLGSIEFMQNESEGTIVLHSFDANDTRYSIDIHKGSCGEPGAVLSTWSDLQGASSFIETAHDAVDLLDGEHSLLLKSGETDIHCMPMGNIVAGWTDGGPELEMVDQKALSSYRASVHEATDGELVMLVPLTLRTDPKTAAPTAFDAVIPYQRDTDAALKHELSMVWMVQMLGDDGQQRVVHQMREEPFYLTGIAVQEDYGHELALIYEDPEVDERLQTDDDPATAQHLQVDDDLWALANGLQEAFIGNRLDNDGQRSMSVDTIEARWGSRSQDFDDTARWGIDAEILNVHRFSFKSTAELGRLGSEEIPSVLNQTFGNGRRAIPDIEGNPETQLRPTLLTAMESKRRTLNLDRAKGQASSPLVEVASNSLTLRMVPSEVQVGLSASLSWKPYRYNMAEAEWELDPIDQYWPHLKSVLKATPAYRPLRPRVVRVRTGRQPISGCPGGLCAALLG